MTCDTKLVLLHPVRYGGHVLHSGASRARNIETLYFILRWAQCESHKKRTGTHYVELVFLHLVWSMGHVVRAGSSGS
jgi:hypothetical protein